MDISNRIKAIVNEIKYDNMADIGTDHGYIPISAVLCGKVKKAIACDINKKPLERAKANIDIYRFEKEIETRLGSGLSCLKPGEADVAVIAGMGGMLIIDILRESSNVVSDLKQLIISPHLNVPELRLEVHKMGFSIGNEVIIKEFGEFYNILSCEQGIDDNYSETDYILGKKLIESMTSVFYDFLKYKITELNRIIEKIELEQIRNKKNQSIRLREIDKLYNIYKAVIDKWE